MHGIFGCFHLVPAFLETKLRGGVLSLSNAVRFQSRCSRSIELCLVSEETSLVLQLQDGLMSGGVSVGA